MTDVGYTIAISFICWLGLDILYQIYRKWVTKMNDFVFEFKPCYPPRTRAEQQIKKLQEEWMEIVVAEDWEEQAAEYLDYAQVVVGLNSIVNNEEVVEIPLDDIKYYIDLYDEHYRTPKEDLCYMDNRLNFNELHELIKVALCCFYKLVSDHDRNNEHYRFELIERFMDEHNEKICNVRQLMEEGVYPNKEVI